MRKEMDTNDEVIYFVYRKRQGNRVKEFEFARYILDVFVQLAVSAFYSVAQPNKQPSTRNPNE